MAVVDPDAADVAGHAEVDHQERVGVCGGDSKRVAEGAEVVLHGGMCGRHDEQLQLKPHHVHACPAPPSPARAERV